MLSDEDRSEVLDLIEEAQVTMIREFTMVRRNQVSLKGDVAKAHHDINVLQDDLQSLRDEMKQGFAELRIAIRGLGQDYNSLRGDADDLKVSVTGLEDGFNDLEVSVTGLKDGFNDLTESVGDLKVRVGSLEDRMTGLEDRMTGLEDRMTGLEELLHEVLRRLPPSQN